MRALVFAALAVTACGDAPAPKPTAVVAISAVMPGGSAEVVEQSVVIPLERAVAGLDGVAEITSRAESSTATVVVALAPGHDVHLFTLAAQKAVQAVLPSLPPYVNAPVIQKQRADDQPVLTLELSGDVPRTDLSELADTIVVREIERLVGVGRIERRGVSLPALIVRPDRQRMQAYGITILDVTTTLQQGGVDVPGGRIDSPGHGTLRISSDKLDIETAGQLVITQRGDVPVRVRDIADLHVGPESPSDGPPRLAVHAQLGAVPAEVRERVREAIKKLALPSVVKVGEVASEGPAPTELVMSIIGPERGVLEEIATELETELRADGVVRDPPRGTPEQRIDIDRDRAAMLGISVSDVAATIRAGVGAQHVGEVMMRGERRKLLVQLDLTQQELGDLAVRGHDGRTLRLADLVRVTAELSAPVLLRHGLQRAIDLRAPAAAVAKARKRVLEAAAKWPPGYRAVVPR